MVRLKPDTTSDAGDVDETGVDPLGVPRGWRPGPAGDRSTFCRQELGAGASAGNRARAARAALHSERRRRSREHQEERRAPATDARGPRRARGAAGDRGQPAGVCGARGSGRDADAAPLRALRWPAGGAEGVAAAESLPARAADRPGRSRRDRRGCLVGARQVRRRLADLRTFGVGRQGADRRGVRRARRAQGARRVAVMERPRDPRRRGRGGVAQPRAGHRQISRQVPRRSDGHPRRSRSFERASDDRLRRARNRDARSHRLRPASRRPQRQLRQLDRRTPRSGSPRCSRR